MRRQSTRQCRSTSASRCNRRCVSQENGARGARDANRPRIPLSTDCSTHLLQRNAKKLSQKGLAQQCMIPQGIINDYEAGRAIPDNALIGKFERVLGVKLPRAPKKK